jgi:ABC-2 type transport system ATP-binding protein
MIKVSQVDKYFDRTKALDGLDINVEKGSIYGLVGTNGAGKTTVIKSIMGIQRPDAGSISVDGQPVYENPAVKSRIGYVSDDLFFFAGYSLLDMRKYLKGIYPDWNDERFENLVGQFGLDPKGKLNSFSKGMQKQAAIIMALSIMPDVLVLDEPIDGLDPMVRLKAWKYIIEDVAERNVTVLISSHNLREMEGYCDHIGIISNGHMVIERDLEDLKTDVHKVQVAFRGNAGDLYEPLNVLHRETRGSVDILIIKDKREKIEEVIGRAKPAVFDLLPLSLEEIFIYELGGADDEIRNII